MTDILLIISFIVVAVFGFFIMARLDKFMEKNSKAIKEEKKKKQEKAHPADSTQKEVKIREKTNDK